MKQAFQVTLSDLAVADPILRVAWVQPSWLARSLRQRGDLGDLFPTPASHSVHLFLMQQPAGRSWLSAFEQGRSITVLKATLPGLACEGGIRLLQQTSVSSTRAMHGDSPLPSPRERNVWRQVLVASAVALFLLALLGSIRHQQQLAEQQVVDHHHEEVQPVEEVEAEDYEAVIFVTHPKTGQWQGCGAPCMLQNCHACATMHRRHCMPALEPCASFTHPLPHAAPCTPPCTLPNRHGRSALCRRSTTVLHA